MRLRLLPLLAAAIAARAGAVELNLITAVELKDEGADVVLSVKGTKKPNFTTFSMADPPRFVIDFSESKFQGVPDQLKGAGVVQLVKNQSYGADATSIARVMIAFTAEVDPPAVEDAGDRLVVRIAKGAGADVARAEPAAADTAQADEAAKAKADADSKAKAEAAAAAQAKADADSKAKAEAAAAAQARADADSKAKAEADDAARQKAVRDELAAEEKTKADAPAQAEPAALPGADADAKPDAAAAVLAKVDAAVQAKADAAAARAQAKADAKAKADAAAQAKAQAKADAAQAKAAARAAPAATEQASAGDDADQAALEAEIAAAKSETGGAKGKVASGRPSTTETLSPGAASGPSNLREVGFKQLPGASRVFVRTSSAPQYTVQEVDERTIRIVLSNVRVSRRNDTRLLDTTFFASAVQSVKPSREGGNYVLEVKLRQRVPYEQKVEGDMLAVDFQRPIVTAAVAAPAATKQRASPAGSGEDAAETP